MDRIRHGAIVPLERDLFGEVPVSLDELMLWMLAVPGIAPDSPRFWPYVRGWNVFDKIRAAKLNGTFEATIGAESARPPPVRLAHFLEYYRRPGSSAR